LGPTYLLSVKFVPLQTFDLVSVLWQSACLLVQTASLRHAQSGRKLEEKVDKVKFRAELPVRVSLTTWRQTVKLRIKKLLNAVNTLSVNLLHDREG